MWPRSSPSRPFYTCPIAPPISTLSSHHADRPVPLQPEGVCATGCPAALRRSGRPAIDNWRDASMQVHCQAPVARRARTIVCAAAQQEQPVAPRRVALAALAAAGAVGTPRSCFRHCPVSGGAARPVARRRCSHLPRLPCKNCVPLLPPPAVLGLGMASEAEAAAPAAKNSSRASSEGYGATGG